MYDYILVYRILWQRRSCTTSLRSIGGAGPTWRSCRLLTRCPKLTDPWTSWNYAQFSLTRYLPGRKLREIDTYWAPPTRCPKLTDHVLFGITLSSLFLEYLLGRKLKRNWHLLCQDIVQNWLQNLAISKSGKGSFWNSESESEHELYRFPTEKRIVGLPFHHCIPFTVLFSIYIQD